MNFRVLATRLKESASEVALKIPTFDDMAARDTYIHSDGTDDLYDFNIPPEQQQHGERGGTTTNVNVNANSNKSTKQQQKQQEPHPSFQSPPPPHQIQQHQPETLQAGNDGDETSSHGSGWSLLDRDRRRGQASPVINKSEVLVSPLASAIPSAQQQNQQQQQQHQEQPSPMTSKNTARIKQPHASLPILSVVADALLDDPATSRRNNDTDHQPSEKHRRRVVAAAAAADHTSVSMMSDSGSDNDDNDNDEDDPILAMIRKSQPEKFQTKKPNGNKEKRQFTSSESSLSSSSSRREERAPFQQVNNHQHQQHPPTKEEKVRLLHATDELRSSRSSHGSYNGRSGATAPSDGDDICTPHENERNKKNPQRFLDDLDQRLSSTPEPFDIESGQATNAEPLSSSNLLVNQLGGWVKTIASGKVDQWLGRTPTTTQDKNYSNVAINTNPLSWMSPKFREPSSQQQQQQQHRPPLARLPKVATPGPFSPENEFSVANSTTILLADDELAQLAQFKTRSNTMWDMMVTVHTWMKENRQFAFIGATMLLAAFVYFYKGAASIRPN